MPLQSYPAKLQVFKNLVFQHRVTMAKRPGFNKWEMPTDQQLRRDQFLLKLIRKRYVEEDVQKMLTNRRSLGTDEAVVKDFFTNEFPQHHTPRDEHYLRALRVVKEQMKPNRMLHPVAFPDLMAYPATLNVSAELPWTNPEWEFEPQGRNFDYEHSNPRIRLPDSASLKRFYGKTKVPAYLRWKQQMELALDSAPSYHNLYNEIFDLNRRLIHQIKYKMHPFWQKGRPIPYERLKIHLRTHVVPEDKPDKVRAVFGAPKLLLHSELMFIWPLQATYQNSDAGRLFWNREIGRGGGDHYCKRCTVTRRARTYQWIGADSIEGYFTRPSTTFMRFGGVTTTSRLTNQPLHTRTQLSTPKRSKTYGNG